MRLGLCPLALNHKPSVLSFPRQSRLLNARSYKNVFDEPTQRKSDQHTVILAKTNDLGYARLGLVVSKKNVKLAVNRNKVKRVIRESFRHCQVNLNSLDVVVIAKQGIGLKTKIALREQLDKLWSKLIKR